MSFLMQFGINKHLLDHKLHLPTCIKFTRHAYLFQIAPEIMTYIHTLFNMEKHT